LVVADRLLLTVLGGLAEFERELIRVRSGEGRVIPGRHRKVANPESLTLDRRLWVPARRFCGAPGQL